jgi:hypothetical protein
MVEAAAASGAAASAAPAGPSPRPPPDETSPPATLSVPASSERQRGGPTSTPPLLSSASTATTQHELSISPTAARLRGWVEGTAPFGHAGSPRATETEEDDGGGGGAGRNSATYSVEGRGIQAATVREPARFSIVGRSARTGQLVPTAGDAFHIAIRGVTRCRGRVASDGLGSVYDLDLAAE